MTKKSAGSACRHTTTVGDLPTILLLNVIKRNDDIMPSNKKNKKKNQKSRPLQTGKERLRLLKRPGEPDAPCYHAPVEHRPIPNMHYKPSRILDALERLKHKNSLTPTETRFLQAHEMTTQFVAPVLRLPAPFRKITDLYTQTSFYTHTCILYIRSCVSTDFRLPVKGWIREFEMPDCVFHVTNLEPLGQGSTQLLDLDPHTFVDLLASTIVLYQIGMADLALKMVHELHLHAEKVGPEWWAELLEEDTDDDSLIIDAFDIGGHEVYVKDWKTETYLRFALATLGTKVSRKLYRERDQRMALPDNSRTTSKFLLDAFEIFAEEQCHYWPKSGVGFYNLAWVARESPRQRKADGLEAAAEALALHKRCFELADCTDEIDQWEYQDDFLRANARIEAALCLTLGAAGVVTWPDEKGQVHRDMRSKESRGFLVLSANSSVQPFQLTIAAKTPEDQAEMIANEKQRMEQGIPPTYLAPGETLLVPRCEVLQFWNEAMQGPYDALCCMGYQECVYGETGGWDSVVKFLEITRNFEPNQLGFPSTPPGFPALRDKGFEYGESITCARCRKRDPNIGGKCSRCHKVCYCSRECQVAHWKQHKRECQPSS